MIVTTADGAETLLESMGLNSGLLIEVCRRGLSQYLTATPFHAPNSAGSFLYHEVVPSLRQELVPLGWGFDDSSLALVFNEETKIAIAVRSGDSGTGDPEQTPWFKHSESSTMQFAFSGNALQLGLFDGIADLEEFANPPKSRKGIDYSKFQTWWLLHHVDTFRRIMRAELSLPVSDGRDGMTHQWKTRIILDSIPFDDEPQLEPRGGDPGRSDFDVVVRKKAL